MSNSTSFMTHVVDAIDFKSALDAISVTTNGKHAVVAGRDVLRLVQINESSLEEVRTLRTGKKANLTSSSRDCKCHPMQEFRTLVATGATNGAVVTWNIAAHGRSAQENVFKFHERSVNRVSWLGASNPYIVASASLDKTVAIWDLRAHDGPAHVIRHMDPVFDVTYDPHGGAGGHGCYMAAGLDDGTLCLYDSRKYDSPVKELDGAHSGLIMALEWHPDFPGIIASGGRDKAIKVWELYHHHGNAADIFRPETESSVNQDMHNHPSHNDTVSKTKSKAPKPLVSLQSIVSTNIGRLAWRSGCPRQIAVAASVLHTRVHVWDTSVPNFPVAVFDAHKDAVSGMAWLGPGPQITQSYPYGKHKLMKHEEHEHNEPLHSSVMHDSFPTGTAKSTSTKLLDGIDDASLARLHSNYPLLTASKDGWVRLLYAKHAYRPHDMLRTTACALSHTDAAWVYGPLARKSYWADQTGVPDERALLNSAHKPKKTMVTLMRPGTALNGRVLPPLLPSSLHGDTPVSSAMNYPASISSSTIDSPTDTPQAATKLNSHGNLDTFAEENSRPLNETETEVRRTSAMCSSMTLDAFGPPPLWYSYRSSSLSSSNNIKEHQLIAPGLYNTSFDNLYGKHGAEASEKGKSHRRNESSRHIMGRLAVPASHSAATGSNRVFITLAELYQLEGAPIPHLCLHNAEAAASVGAHELRQVWMSIALLYTSAKRTALSRSEDPKKDLTKDADVSRRAEQIWQEILQNASGMSTPALSTSGMAAKSISGNTTIQNGNTIHNVSTKPVGGTTTAHTTNRRELNDYFKSIHANVHSRQQDIPYGPATIAVQQASKQHKMIQDPFGLDGITFLNSKREDRDMSYSNVPIESNQLHNSSTSVGNLLRALKLLDSDDEGSGSDESSLHEADDHETFDELQGHKRSQSSNYDENGFHNDDASTKHPEKVSTGTRSAKSRTFHYLDQFQLRISEKPSDIITELLRSSVVSILDFYCERGDVQTCAAIARVLTSEPSHTSPVANFIDGRKLEQWELAYVDILHRHRLWAPASTVLARSQHERTQQINQQGTSVHATCARCKAALDIPRKRAIYMAQKLQQEENNLRKSSKPTNSQSTRTKINKSGSDGTGTAALLVPAVASYCLECNSKPLRCVICELQVRGLFLQCAACGVGGHLACMTAWFQRDGQRKNPGGLGHVCIL